MQILEEDYDVLVDFCHFRTYLHRNVYNLTFTKLDASNIYEIHLLPCLILAKDNVVRYDPDLRTFICSKIRQFMVDKGCSVYFSINSVGNNKALFWKFLRWIRCHNRLNNNEISIKFNVVDRPEFDIRFFEITLSL